jgi:D-alanine transaminase/branched-chain amino acid aminotransferase
MAVYFNDQFVTYEEALLHVSDLSIQRGFGVFDFFRTINGRPLFLQDHLHRFYASAQALHLPVRYTQEQLSDIIHELIQRSAIAEAGIRITLTGGYSPNGYTIANPNLIITCNPVTTATPQDVEKGYRLITYEHQRELPHIKSINYLMAVWLQPLIKQHQADDVLYVHNNSITELPRSNIFIVTKENTLVTPAHNMLRGITRQHILQLATTTMSVEERNITVEELLAASEVFISSTTKKILPVLHVNGTTIGNGQPGTITKNLYQQFIALEQAFTNG